MRVCRPAAPPLTPRELFYRSVARSLALTAVVLAVRTAHELGWLG